LALYFGLMDEVYFGLMDEVYFGLMDEVYFGLMDEVNFGFLPVGILINVLALRETEIRSKIPAHAVSIFVLMGL